MYSDVPKLDKEIVRCWFGDVIDCWFNTSRDQTNLKGTKRNEYIIDIFQEMKNFLCNLSGR